MYLTYLLLLLHSTASLWEDCNFILKIVQTAAVMEIVHSMVGFVRSPVFTTFLQGILHVFVSRTQAYN